MPLITNLGGDSVFDAIQARFEAEEKAKSTKENLGSFKKGSKSKNTVRLYHAKRMKPDRKYVKRYEEALSKAYAEALQMQLGVEARGQRNGIRTRFQNVGKASGTLIKSIKAETKVRIIHDTQKGSYRIYYSIKQDYSSAVGTNGFAYGDSLNYDRGTKQIGYETILRWIKQKQKLKGGLKIYNRFKRKRSETGFNKEKALKKIAFAIAKSMHNEPKPAVLANWSNYDKNEKLQRDFDRLIKSKGAYHRSQIRKSIIRNTVK